MAISTNSFASTSEAAPVKQYDGIWFMGFNMHKDLFSDRNGLFVRQAFNLAVDRAWIARNIVSDEVVPTGIIPPGMLGFDPDLKGFDFDLKQAKELMRLAGYPPSDKRLKGLTLLHTDGEKTKEIAKWIKRHLINLGVDLKLVEVSYADNDAWQKALESGKYHLFFMGYKASLFNQVFIGDKMTKIFHNVDCVKIPSAEAQEFFGSFDEAVTAGHGPCEICRPAKKTEADSFDLIEPLFHSGGSVNFTFYQNSRVDSLLNQMNQIDPVLRSSREEKLREINRILLDDPPSVNIFYITKL